MTKNELREALLNGKRMDELFEFSPGQDCEIFKADAFSPGYDIIYIPDLDLNHIPAGICSEEEADEVLFCCYTGEDFIDECGGDEIMAGRLFWYCDWQHPSSAIDEIQDDEDEVWPEPNRYQKLLLAVAGWLKASLGETAAIRNLYGVGFATNELIDLGFDPDEVKRVADAYDGDLPFI